MTQAEIEAIVLAEFRYWSGPDVPGDLGMTGSGAAANIYAAIKGFPAPWHHKTYFNKLVLPDQPPAPVPVMQRVLECSHVDDEQQIYWVRMDPSGNVTAALVESAFPADQLDAELEDMRKFGPIARVLASRVWIGEQLKLTAGKMFKPK